MKSFELQIALVRSCPTFWDNQKRLTGVQDVPLSEEGKESAALIARQLDFHSFAAIVSAPCQSAIETAKILGKELSLRIRKDPLLQNVDLGLWEGRQVKELKSCQPKMLRHWQEAPDVISPPEGETTEVVRKRIQKSLKRWGKRYDGKRIILVVPEPLASVVKSEWEQTQIEDLRQMTERSGEWEWLKTVRTRV